MENVQKGSATGNVPQKERNYLIIQYSSHNYFIFKSKEDIYVGLSPYYIDIFKIIWPQTRK